MEDTRTIQELIQNAWDLQNACNLSGVVFSFAKDMQRLCDILKAGTAERNTHIVCKLYASKILSLSGDLPIDLSVYGIKF